MALEKLDLAFVPFSGFQRLKRSQISPFAGTRITLAGIQAVSAVFELSDHKSLAGFAGPGGFAPGGRQFSPALGADSLVSGAGTVRRTAPV